MRIRIDDIKDEGLILDFVERLEDLPLLQQMQEAGELLLSAPVKVHLRAMYVHGLVEVEGRLESEVRLACGRCLNEFLQPVSTHFALTFARELPEVEEDGRDEVELSAEEMGLIPFEGEEVDLRGPLQEQVLMALPQRVLCSEACKGLCPTCGANLNRESCSCEAPVFNSKFAALKDFKAKK